MRSTSHGAGGIFWWSSGGVVNDDCKMKGRKWLQQTSIMDRLILMIALTIHCCSSDFNVVIPEICNMDDDQIPVNITWIREMVLLGIRDDRPQMSLNIFGPQEICDGSSGLLKFLSLSKEEKSEQMIGSLKPHLCETAATFLYSRNQEFTSWTCSKAHGVISIKPLPSDVILAINRLLKYLKWSKFAFAKFQYDNSPYCDVLGSALEKNLRNHDDTNNATVLIFGKYEDLKESRLEKLEGIFLCISYDYGLTHRLKGGGGPEGGKKGFGGLLPSVILPEWPLPLELYSSSSSGGGGGGGGGSVLALMSHPHPYNFKSSLQQHGQPHQHEGEKSPQHHHHSHQSSSPSSSSSLELEETKTSWESFPEFIPLEPQDAKSSSKKKILEPLLARLILHSVKISIEYASWKDKRKKQKLDKGFVSLSSSSSSSGSVVGDQSDNLIEANTNLTTKSHPTFKSPSFRFLVFKFEKDRWHPLVNLVPGDNLVLQSPLGESRHHRPDLFKKDETDGGDDESIVNWVQIIGVTILTVIIVGSVVGLSFYAREKYQNHLYTVANTHATNQKKLIPRTRNQGPYKLLLTSRDICFNVNPVYNENKESLGKVVLPLSFDGPGSGVIVAGVNSGGSGSNILAKEHQQIPFSRTPSVDDPGEKPDLIKGSTNTNKKALSIANMKNDSIILSENQARYKGDMVHLRKLTEPTDSFEIKSKAMNVLETIHGLRHENLVALIGVLTDGIPSMVWEYCSRGSLHDVIKQQDIKLDWAFKLSLLTDLVRGMRYLHSSLVRVHGFLTSYNCVIDARWVLKITDYGILSFHHNQGLPLNPRSNKELLWTAPELLRDEGLRKHGTQPGDVYSFAIIMQEILVRGEPYCMLNITTEEILEKVRRPPPLIRPSVSKSVAPPEAINIMRQCWAEIPDMRPDFMVIHDLFKTLNHGRKANIVDTMFEMLEKYSNNLEELIRERTELLDLEKKKTEQLLNRMLPSTVAEKLKLGLPVDPEDFSEVTIYFSDIVGFTTISAYSTPFEVVDLLNDLYTAFDATINDYNVYKVETIGDAYMVVGGAPVRSPDHVDQIATMALDLLHESGKFRIRHLPYAPLRLRIGIHTGPCCAGVVGLTMPRYCLFGDTVNTASRMESTGAAWRIHISSSTKSKLDRIGGYVIEYRGVTEIKGKGKMPTYWLLGKEGFHKELPEPPSVSAAHGMDEKSILYGRTGIRQEVDAKTAFKDSRPNSQDGCSSSATNLDPLLGKTSPAFTLLQGTETLRSLSPAEEVAHQLLNGRPAVRGLRRQFSLDQGSNYYIAPPPGNKSMLFRKTPSLEETTIGDHGRNSNSFSPKSIEVPSVLSTKFVTASISKTLTLSSGAIDRMGSGSGSSSLKTIVSSSANNINSGETTDNKELLSSNNKSNKITLSPRPGRSFIKSTSLTIVEESPTLE